MTSILNWKEDVQAYLDRFAEGCPDEFVPQGCPCCGAEHALHCHGHYHRTVTTMLAFYIIPVFRFRCPGCRRTVSLLPSFVGRYQQMAWDVQEQVLHKHEEGIPLDAIAGQFKRPVDPISSRTLWRWVKAWRQRLLLLAMIPWRWLLGRLPHLRLPLGANKPKSDWSWLALAWQQVVARLPVLGKIGMLAWLYGLLVLTVPDGKQCLSPQNLSMEWVIGFPDNRIIPPIERSNAHGP